MNQFDVYPIDLKIAQILAGHVNEETGEIECNLDELDNLLMERSTICENVAMQIKNYRSIADAIKKEAEVLNQRKKDIEAAANRLEKKLAAMLNYENLATARVDVSFRKSESTEIPNEHEFVKWANEKGLYYLVNRKVTETPNRAEIKRAIKAGAEIEGAYLSENKNMTIK